MYPVLADSMGCRAQHVVQDRWFVGYHYTRVVFVLFVLCPVGDHGHAHLITELFGGLLVITKWSLSDTCTRWELRSPTITTSPQP